MSDRLNFCERCGCALAEGLVHDDALSCINFLRDVIKRKTDAGSMLAFEVSTRILGILEGLANDPSVGGMRFHVHNHDTGEKLELPPQQVVGVMTSIYREYQKAGDWSPLRDLEKQARENGRHAYDLLMALILIINDPGYGSLLREDLKKCAADAVEAARQHGVHLLDHDRS